WGLSRLAAPTGGLRGTRFEVPARPVDALLDDLGVAEVALVKMDIEGAEALALPGMRAGLRAGRYRRVLIELHPEAIRDLGSDAEAAIRPLVEAGYKGWTVDHSAGTSRDAAYGRVAGPEALLRLFDPSAPLDAWPHQLWEAPGV